MPSDFGNHHANEFVDAKKVKPMKPVAALTIAFMLALLPTFAGAVVQTDAGLVEGVRTGRLTVYKGIPFAAPPVGSLRWRESQPVNSWNGARKADKFCPGLYADRRLHAWRNLNGGQRRLPLPEYLDASAERRCATAGHGLDLWRRLFPMAPPRCPSIGATVSRSSARSWSYLATGSGHSASWRIRS